MKAAFKLPYPMVLVLWEDCKLLSAGWMSIQSVLDDAELGVPIISAGFVIEDVKDYLVLASSVDLDSIGGHKVSEVVKIPRRQITKIHKIKGES